LNLFVKLVVVKGEFEVKLFMFGYLNNINLSVKITFKCKS